MFVISTTNKATYNTPLIFESVGKVIQIVTVASRELAPRLQGWIHAVSRIELPCPRSVTMDLAAELP
jgi:hypothetical protein